MNQSTITEIGPDKYKQLKLTTAIIGLAYSFYYLATKMDWHFIDNVDLLIHEAGHIIFMFFGNTMYVAGGSILQVLIPIIFLVYFFLRQAYFSAVFMAYWTGISLINVSVYAGDAVKMQLPLLTGDTESHDWNQLLFSHGLLHQTNTVSQIILLIGILFILLGAALCVYAWRQSN
jgi:hypothetical protein